MLKALISSFLFPQLCAHCEHPCDRLFCTSCISLFELIDIKRRCRFCFKESSLRGMCTKCESNAFLDWEIGSALSYEGPVQTFMKLFKYQNQWSLAYTAAAYMLIQWHELNWPIPHAVISVPQFPLKTLLRGYNQSELLAKAFANLLKVPYVNALSRRMGRPSQSLLKRQERKKLTPDYFSLKKGKILEDKIVLLIDDVLTTGTTLKCCAETLFEAYPKKIYALTFCESTNQQ